MNYLKSLFVTFLINLWSNNNWKCDNTEVNFMKQFDSYRKGRSWMNGLVTELMSTTLGTVFELVLIGYSNKKSPYIFTPSPIGDRHTRPRFAYIHIPKRRQDSTVSDVSFHQLRRSVSLRLLPRYVGPSALLPVLLLEPKVAQGVNDKSHRRLGSTTKKWTRGTGRDTPPNLPLEVFYTGGPWSLILE